MNNRLGTPLLSSILLGEGLPVILIHGIASSALGWSSLQSDLAAADYQAIAPDLIGHGDSFKPEEPDHYHVKELFQTFEAWIESLQISQHFSLVGHSLGGHLSLQYCLYHPERVRCLILIDPFYSPRQLSPAIRLLYRRPEFGVQALKRASEQSIRAAVGLGAAVSGRFSPEFRQQIVLDIKRAAPEILHILPTVPDLSPFLPQIPTRTLVIWGNRDLTLLPSSFPKIVAALPDATSEKIKYCGHQPHLSRPDLVNPFITAFLEENYRTAS